MEMRWKRYAVFRVSPLLSVILFSMSWIRSVASAFHDPLIWYEDVGIGDVHVFSLLGDGGVVCCCSCLYRGAIKFGLCVRIRYSYVPSHLLPWTLGINVAPSGYLSFTHDRPSGSLEAGT